jgi:scyllo-inositol 2-dehydrogenase (NADP+)
MGEEQMAARIGIMGAGWVARSRYLPHLATERGAELVAVFDSNPERAREAAAAFAVPLGTGDRNAFFDQHLDAVAVCTPPFSHAELTFEALRHGCHVLTEKPMAMNTAEARAMQAAAADAGRLLCASHNFLFSRAVQRADAARRRTGAVQYAMGLQLSSDRRRLPEWYEQLPGGLLFDELPHLLYLLQHYLGRLRLEGVRVSRRSPAGHPTLTEIQVTGEHGPGQATVVLGAPISEWHVTAIMERGVVDLDLFRDVAVLLGSDGRHQAADVLRTSARAVWEHGRGFVASGARMTARRLFWGHDVLIRRFLGAVEGTEPVPVEPADALAVVALTDDILRALG